VGIRGFVLIKSCAKVVRGGLKGKSFGNSFVVKREEKGGKVIG